MNNEFDIKTLIDLIDYEDQKKYFEAFFAKDLQTGNIVKKTNQGVKLFKQSYLVSMFSHVATNGSETEKFIKTWIKDGRLRCVNSIVYNPKGCQEQDEENDMINLHVGWNTFTRVHYDHNKTNDILRPWFDIGRELCEGNDQVFGIFLMFLANIFQNPQRRVNIIWCFIMSMQGIGKNMFMLPLSILLSNNFVCSSNPQDFFGNHSESLVNKLLAVLDEFEIGTGSKFEARIKDAVTANEFAVNPKGVRPFTVKSFINFVVFSNKDFVTLFDGASGDRRFICLKPTNVFSDKNKYNRTFWSRVDTHFRSNTFLTTLFDYLATKNINGLNWFELRSLCLTETYWTLYENSLPVVARFFYNFNGGANIGTFQYCIEDNSQNVRVKTTTFLENITRFQKELGESFSTNKELLTHIKYHYEGIITIGVYGGYKVYKYNTAVVLQHVMARWFNHRMAQAVWTEGPLTNDDWLDNYFVT